MIWILFEQSHYEKWLFMEAQMTASYYTVLSSENTWTNFLVACGPLEIPADDRRRHARY